SAVNKPVNFSTGVFAGRTIRVELEEIQNAELGRKYARKDKRPLDPPPVVLCRFFEVFRSVSNAESEMDPMQASFGAICHADLFPVPSTNQHPFLLPALPSIRPPSTATVAAHALIPSSAGSGVANQKPDVVAWFGSHAICESDKWTNMLAGGSSVHASIIKYQGRESAMFVFPDLSVRAEGTFVLRFRVSCVFSGPACQGASHPILAECFGRPFEIFPTKGFPGLGASTALTKV
ncbi:velvet factor, partial [Trametes meyenii]